MKQPIKNISHTAVLVLLLASVGVACSNPNLPRFPEDKEEPDPNPQDPQQPASIPMFFNLA